MADRTDPNDQPAAGREAVRASLARRRQARLKPALTLPELLDIWAEARRPAPKSEHGARRAVEQFTALIGDMPIVELVAKDLFDYRDAVARLPRQLTADVDSIVMPPTIPE